MGKPLDGPGEAGGVNAHYGQDPIVKIYITVTDRYAPLHQEVIAGTASEAVHSLDGILDEKDRLDNVGQIRALRSAGYAGPLSFEPFSPAVHALEDPARALADSIAFIRARL
jgi:hypothetical protein